MRILVTNDDGVDAPGLAVLAEAARLLSDDIVVVAPDRDYSGSGAALGPLHLTRRVLYRQHEIDRLREIPVFAVDGPPALGVLAACLSGFGAPPNLVLSGVNPGLNTGRAVLHSGTVGAALTALNHGIPGIAVSLEAGDRPQWETAALIAVWAAGVLVRSCEPSVLSLNVPNVPLAEVRGVRRATPGTFGSVRVAFAPVGEGTLELEITDQASVEEPSTESGIVRDGRVALTSLAGLCHPAPAAGVGVAAVLDERLRRTPALV